MEKATRFKVIDLENFSNNYKLVTWDSNDSQTFASLGLPCYIPEAELYVKTYLMVDKDYLSLLDLAERKGASGYIKLPKRELDKFTRVKVIHCSGGKVWLFNVETELDFVVDRSHFNFLTQVDPLDALRANVKQNYQHAATDQDLFEYFLTRYS